MKIEFRFESDSDDFVSVLGNARFGGGNLASQNAGSNLHGIYYKVGGGGVNGLFHSALGKNETDAANKKLVAAYDACYGAGAYDKDSPDARKDRLHSFYIPVDAGNSASAGDQAVGMVYTVGPIIPKPTAATKQSGKFIIDADQYMGLYRDAIDGIVAANGNSQAGVNRLRLSVVSAGIFGKSLDASELKDLYKQACGLIIDGIRQAAGNADESLVPQTILINNGEADITNGFTDAANGMSDITMVKDGFDLQV